jgi:hypothetical protein
VFLFLSNWGHQVSPCYSLEIQSLVVKGGDWQPLAHA